MSTLNEVMAARRELAGLVEISRGAGRTKGMAGELSAKALHLRRLQDRWYEEEVHTWAHLVPSRKLMSHWNELIQWCEHHAGEGNYLVYLPKGQPRVLCLRDPGHATYLKLTFG